jgi:hypothetical protein
MRTVEIRLNLFDELFNVIPVVRKPPGPGGVALAPIRLVELRESTIEVSAPVECAPCRISETRTCVDFAGEMLRRVR